MPEEISAAVEASTEATVSTETSTPDSGTTQTTEAQTTTPVTPVTPVTQDLTRDDYLARSKYLKQNRPIPTETPIDGTTPVETDAVKPQETPTTPTAAIPEKVKLPDGTEVPFEELTKGYMMQADYTKKTQALSVERQKLQAEQEAHKTQKEQADKALGLWTAIERDPIGTLNKLYAHYDEQGIQEPKDPAELAMEDKRRELEAREQALASKQQQTEQEETLRQIGSQMEALAAKYKGFDAEKVIAYAIENNIPDPEKAFKAMDYENRIAELEQAKKTGVIEYVKSKTVKAGEAPPIGTSVTGGAPPVQINAPSDWRSSKLAALARLTGT